MRRRMFACATALMVTAGAAGHDGRREAIEYPIRAAYLYQFARFVEWPDETAGRERDLVIGVLGDTALGDALDRVVAGKKVRGHGLAVRRLESAPGDGVCDIVFIGGGDDARVAAALEKLRGVPVLTVGDRDGFVQRGGMIGFVVEDGRVRFDVNLHAARQAGLRVSAQLLGVARSVDDASTRGR